MRVLCVLVLLAVVVAVLAQEVPVDHGDEADNYEDDMFLEEDEDLDRKPSPDEVHGAFMLYDTNKNGFLSMKELHKAVETHGGEPWSKDDAYTFFTEADEDGDGQLSPEEFLQVLIEYDETDLSGYEDLFYEVDEDMGLEDEDEEEEEEEEEEEKEEPEH